MKIRKKEVQFTKIKHAELKRKKDRERQELMQLRRSENIMTGNILDENLRALEIFDGEYSSFEKISREELYQRIFKPLLKRKSSSIRRQSTEFINLGGMANASFANIVDFALPIRIGYIKTQVAHFGGGIDFDYLRTVVLTISMHRLDYLRIASISMVPSALTHDAKCDNPSNCRTDDTHRCS
jgi:hypothetical protein